MNSKKNTAVLKVRGYSTSPVYITQAIANTWKFVMLAKHRDGIPSFQLHRTGLYLDLLINGEEVSDRYSFVWEASPRHDESAKTNSWIVDVDEDTHELTLDSKKDMIIKDIGLLCVVPKVFKKYDSPLFFGGVGSAASLRPLVFDGQSDCIIVAPGEIQYVLGHSSFVFSDPELVGRMIPAISGTEINTQIPPGLDIDDRVFIGIRNLGQVPLELVRGKTMIISKIELVYQTRFWTLEIVDPSKRKLLFAGSGSVGAPKKSKK